MTELVPAFFFPGAVSSQQAEQYREAVVRFARDNGFAVTPRRLCRVEHRVASVDRRDEVGQIESQDGREVVLAILEAPKTFLVVTSSRGFMWGAPIAYHEDEILRAVDFR